MIASWSALPRHFVPISGDLDQDVVQASASQLDGVIVPANYLEWRPRAIVSYRFRARRPKPLLVTPALNRFQFDGWLRNDRDDVRRNVSTLGMKYGEGTPLRLGEKPLTAADLADPSTLERFVLNALSFQEVTLKKQAEAAFPLLLPQGESQQLFDDRRFSPAALVSPSLHIDSVGAEHQRNLQMLDVACRAAGKDVLAMISFDGKLLATPDAKVIAEDYSSMPALGFLIWPTALSEGELLSRPRELHALVEFIQTLVRHGRPVWQLNGGFLSALLSHVGLTGFSQRLSARDTTGQATPPPRMTRAGKWIYWPRLHREIRFDDARNLFDQWATDDYLDLFCPSCPVCKEALESEGMGALDRSLETVWRPKERREVPTDRGRRYASAHLIGVRHREAEIARQPLSTIAGVLAEDAQCLSRFVDTDHLRVLSRRVKELEADEQRHLQPELDLDSPKRSRQPSNIPSAPADAKRVGRLKKPHQ